MIDITSSTVEVLVEAGYTATKVFVGDREVVAFEDATVLGFVFAYEDANKLIAEWPSDVDRAISIYQFGLRKAGWKAWNTYVVLLASSQASYAETISLGAIEENLIGTRKIARAGVNDKVKLRDAIIPLLAIQSAPRLEAVDLVEEIRRRTTELPKRAVDAFLSGADESVVIHVLEEAP